MEKSGADDESQNAAGGSPLFNTAASPAASPSSAASASPLSVPRTSNASSTRTSPYSVVRASPLSVAPVSPSSSIIGAASPASNFAVSPSVSSTSSLQIGLPTGTISHAQSSHGGPSHNVSTTGAMGDTNIPAARNSLATPVYAYASARLQNAGGNVHSVPPADAGDRGSGVQKNKGVAKGGECGCSNAPPHNSPSGGNGGGGAGMMSRNHSAVHFSGRHESLLDSRNRHREKTVNRSRNESAAAVVSHSSAQLSDIALPNIDMVEESVSGEIANTSYRCVDDGGMDDDEIVVDIDDSNEPGSSNVLPIDATASVASDVVVFSAAQRQLHNWQATKSTIKERLSFMFNNELLADVHFIVGKSGHTKRIAAHKFVLSIGSAVFDAMFNGGMATTDAEIELPDIEPAAFQSLLWFFYTDEVKIGPETVMTSLYTAKKYAVPALERACVEFLKRNLSSDNAFMLLTQARLFDEPQLAALCLEMIDKTTSEALLADGFTDIDLDTLCIVLERDTLGIRECKLFAAVRRWSEAECGRRNFSLTLENQRSVLGRALSLVRFPLMTVEEFAAGAAQSGLLTDREVVELFLYYTVTPRPAVNFSDIPRCCLTGKEQVVSRFCQIENRWGYSGTSDRIRFSVNRKIFVVGFGLYGSIHVPADYLVNIQIIHTDSGHTCGANDTNFLSDGSTATFRVLFKEPVEIQPNTSYTACATLKGPDSYYGTKGLRKLSHESLQSGRVTFQFTYAAGNNNGTSVEDGQLPELVFYT